MVFHTLCQWVCLLLSLLHISSTQQTYRLVGGDDVNTGRLEVRVAGTWGTVCAQKYDEKDARVICRKLNLPLTDTRPLKEDLTDSSPPVVLAKLECSGNESSLASCPNVTWGTVPCPSGKLVRVLCQDAEENKFRLMDGNSVARGRVEVYKSGSWGTIHGLYFENSVARVLCRSLGLPVIAARTFLSNVRFGLGNKVWLSDVSCSGEEDSLLDCSHQVSGYHKWQQHMDRIVSCESYRLADRKGNSGVLEVYYDGFWWKVNTDGFNSHAASIACKIMDLPRSGARVLGITENPGSAMSRIFTAKSCSGKEELLANCPRYYNKRWIYSNTTGQVTISCEQTDTSELQFRLVDGPSASFGRLEVFHSNRWGTVCRDRIPDLGAVARVACKTIGQPHAESSVVETSLIKDITEPTLLKGLSCSGDEDNLTSCYFDPWDIDDWCYNWEGLVIHCGSPADNFALRLVDGRDKFSGRVEIRIHGAWGTVCPAYGRAYGDYRPAKVICSQLGFPSSEAKITQCFDSGTGHQWTMDTICSGGEERLSECSRYSPISAQKCDRRDEYRVICNDESVDDTGCFPTPAWVWFAVVGAAIAVLVIACVVVRKIRRRRSSSANDRRPTRTSERVGGSNPSESMELRPPRDQQTSGDTDPPSYSEPPPTYDALFPTKTTTDTALENCGDTTADNTTATTVANTSDSTAVA